MLLPGFTLPASASVEEKFEILKKARRGVSTRPDVVITVNPNDYKVDVLRLRATFVARQNFFKTYYQTTSKSLATLLTNMRA